MKRLLSLTVSVFLGFATVHAATITGNDGGLITQMPGSATDYVFFPGNSSDLTDFSFSVVSDDGQPTGPYGGNGYYSTIETPAGNSSLTGIYYQHSPYSVPNNSAADLVTFTLGNSNTFNYGNFDVFVLYSNADVGEAVDQGGGPYQTRDLGISIGAGGSAVGPSATYVSVNDDNFSTSDARYAEFNIQGLAAGETFTIAASPDGQDPAYIGGVSFESAPEPSIYAMISCGLALLGLADWNRRRLSARA